MKRRTVLSVAALTTITGCLDDSSGNRDNGSDDGSNNVESPPFEITTVDAPGSEAGSVSIPQKDKVMFVNFTLLCPTSEGLIKTIGDALDELESPYEVGPDGDVWFVSAINPHSGPDPSRDELTDWWVEHDGRWTIGIDEDGLLNDHYEIRGFPTVVVADDDGEVHWRDKGGTSSSNMVAGVERALEAEPEVVDPDSDSNETADESEN